MIIRFVLIIAVIAVLSVLGVIHPEDLPWQSREFQVCGITVLIYLFWSAAESKFRGGQGGLPYTVFYAVLLVSVVDSFLLQLTAYGSPWILRWAGAALFAAGSVIRLTAFRLNSVRALRLGRFCQLAGLPVAFGSIIGTVVALSAGIPGSIHEEINLDTEMEETEQ